MAIIKVYTDASSRYRAIVEEVGKVKRNKRTRSSSVGAVIKNGNKTIGTISKKIGEKDSNYAEFLAMYTACQYLISHNITKVHFFVDCINLACMINQGVISGKPELRTLSYKILDTLKEFDTFTIEWIPRRENKEAHKQASKAFTLVG
ncbi:reverse transcriptase-like protein (plasmid) [Rossellomorea sp. AcN35-11]|nr:reverse transcriptase-like protein [Rossellomorea aquimaris]WJV31935.1 reverse transcriptase-like protein [Rossellomorea sp. AcN35-11]